MGDGSMGHSLTCTHDPRDLSGFVDPFDSCTEPLLADPSWHWVTCDIEIDEIECLKLGAYGTTVRKLRKFEIFGI